MTGCERKCANKLLQEILRFHEPPGRGQTCNNKTLELIEKVRSDPGCICLQNMAAQMENIWQNSKGRGCRVPQKGKGMTFKIGASTISRNYKKYVKSPARCTIKTNGAHLCTPSAIYPAADTTQAAPSTASSLCTKNIMLPPPCGSCTETPQ